MKESDRQILIDRAKILAKPINSSEDENTHLKIVSFTLADEWYGIEAAFVREISSLKEYTRIPSSPVHVFGVMNLRGDIVPVVDLRRILDLSVHPPVLSMQIVLFHEENQFSIMVDKIVGLHSLALSDLTPSLLPLSDARGDFIKGITADRLGLLNAEKILKTKLLTA